MAFERIAKSLKGARDDIIKIKSVDEVIPIINKQKIYLYWLQETHAFWNIRVFKEKGIKVDKVLPGISSFQYMMARLMKSWDNAFS